MNFFANEDNLSNLPCEFFSDGKNAEKIYRLWDICFDSYIESSQTNLGDSVKDIIHTYLTQIVTQTSIIRNFHIYETDEFLPTQFFVNEENFKYLPDLFFRKQKNANRVYDLWNICFSAYIESSQVNLSDSVENIIHGYLKSMVTESMGITQPLNVYSETVSEEELLCINKKEETLRAYIFELYETGVKWCPKIKICSLIKHKYRDYYDESDDDDDFEGDDKVLIEIKFNKSTPTQINNFLDFLRKHNKNKYKRFRTKFVHYLDSEKKFVICVNY